MFSAKLRNHAGAAFLCTVVTACGAAQDSKTSALSSDLGSEVTNTIPLLKDLIGQYKGYVIKGYSGDAQGPRRECRVSIGTFRTVLIGENVDGYFVSFLETDWPGTGNPSQRWVEEKWPINAGAVMRTAAGDIQVGQIKRPPPILISGSFRNETVSLRMRNGQLVQAEYADVLKYGLPLPSDESRYQICGGLEKFSSVPKRYERYEPNSENRG